MHFKVIASAPLCLVITLLHQRLNSANSLHNYRLCKWALDLYRIESTHANFAFPEMLFRMANFLWVP